jgi:predicted O-methyltransferase YrrM
MDLREKNLDAVCTIDGWLGRDEAAVLHDLAYHADGPIIEIGSWMGRSTSALALGALMGKKATVYAVDGFRGTQPTPIASSLGVKYQGAECSADLLRANLDRVGVNGQVQIIAKTSEEAVNDVPSECALLFIDGSHDYDSVCRDIDLYGPKVKVGGFIALHDVSPIDPGVVKAVDHKLGSQPNSWRITDLINTTMILRRVRTTSRTIKLLCPGGNYDWGPITGIVQASLGAHSVGLVNNNNGWDDFNHLWVQALNEFEAGNCTHAAMLHSDIAPQAGWLDILADEMEELKLDFISVACAMKDDRAICNCGIGLSDNRWGAWRRIAVKELPSLPPTFDLADLYRVGIAAGENKVLLHNTGCFLADLRSPCFWQQYTQRGIDPYDNFVHDEDDLCAWFAFPTKIVRDKKSGRWINWRESEDWFFSRQLQRLGAKTAITRKVGLNHIGKKSHLNSGNWGTQSCDEATADMWRAKPGEVNVNAAAGPNCPTVTLTQAEQQALHGVKQ